MLNIIDLIYQENWPTCLRWLLLLDKSASAFMSDFSDIVYICYLNKRFGIEHITFFLFFQKNNAFVRI